MARRPSRKGSVKNGTIIWRTDLNLKVVSVSRGIEAPFGTLPAVGRVILKQRRRTGILDYRAHARALGGKASAYRLTLFRRSCKVEVTPRFNRKGKITGVEGRLTVKSASSTNGRSTLKEILAVRQRNSYQSAVRSLELAKAVAAAARTDAEILTSRAALQEQRSLEAQIKAQEEERRARLLADASAVMDTSFDQTENLKRLGDLLVHRMSDWCMIHIRENDLLRRMMVRYRDPARLSQLDRAFPEQDAARLFQPMVSGRTELFPSIAPTDFQTIVPRGERVRALKETLVQSMIRVPVRVHGKAIGMLTLASIDPGRLYDIDDLKMAQALAHRLGLAHESARLYDEAQREIALRKEAEARLRVFNVDLERRILERTRLLEDATREANSFAYTVAHDLRAPLRAITGFCQALREDYSARIDGLGQEYLERIVSGAKRMDLLISDLLDYARLNRAELVRGLVDLDELVEAVLREMGPDLQERKAAVEWERPLGRVVGHAAVLRQVLINLISNAVKFVAPGVAPRVRLRVERLSGRVRLRIQDNGIGIAPQHQERIFGIFERLNRAEDYPGTGIGLAIVRRAVERLAGTVGVESIPNRGSTLWIELPSA